MPRMDETPEIPLLTLRDTLVVAIQGELHDRAAERLQRRILDRIAESRPRGLLIDVTGLPVVDSFLGRLLRDTALMAKMMGVPTVLVGLQPAVAVTLAELGLELPGVHTDLDLERGLAWLQRQGRQTPPAGRVRSR